MWFEEGRGPCLEPLRGVQDLAKLDPGRLEERLRRSLPRCRCCVPAGTNDPYRLCRRPWTVAATWWRADRQGFPHGEALGLSPSFAALIDLLIGRQVATCWHRSGRGGSTQIFDSWAGVWPEPEFRRWCLVKEIIRRVKEFARRSDHPFRGVLDSSMLRWQRRAQTRFPRRRAIAVGAGSSSVEVTLRGNLDPAVLLAGGKARRKLARILETLGMGPSSSI